jgi:hypothetical protein
MSLFDGVMHLGEEGAKVNLFVCGDGKFERTGKAEYIHQCTSDVTAVCAYMRRMQEIKEQNGYDVTEIGKKKVTFTKCSVMVRSLCVV